MLKRFSHIVLSLLLLISTVGLAVSKHYCGDSLVDVAFNENADSCCDSDSCCHNEIHVYQLDADYSVPQIASTPDLMEIAVFSNTVFTCNKFLSEFQQETFHQNNSPHTYTVSEILSIRQVFLL